MITPVPLTDFPILARKGRGGSRLVYLDSGATSQRPQQVIDAEMAFVRGSYGAVNRGAHILAEESSLAYEQARSTIESFVGGSQIVWTKNATEAINLVVSGISRLGLVGPGDEVVVTRAEHHANLVPWQRLCQDTGATLRWIDIVMEGPDLGRLDMSTLDVITPKTKVVAFTHASNVTGAVSPVDQIVAAARSVGAIVVLDACQSVPHMPIDFPALDVDVAAFSGHKMLGPTGIGALWGKPEFLQKLPPYILGGSIVELVSMEETTFAAPPARFEAGTQPVSQAVGMAAAADYLTGIGMDAIARHEKVLLERAMAGITQIDGVRVLGPTTTHDRTGAISFTVDGVHPHDVGQVLDARGVAVRTGHHCAQPIHHACGVFASSRASIGPYNTEADIDVFLDALSGVRPYFGVS